MIEILERLPKDDIHTWFPRPTDVDGNEMLWPHEQVVLEDLAEAFRQKAREIVARYFGPEAVRAELE